MADIEFLGCTEHRGTLDDPCPWCKIERLQTWHSIVRLVCIETIRSGGGDVAEFANKILILGRLATNPPSNVTPSDTAAVGEREACPRCCPDRDRPLSLEEIGANRCDRCGEPVRGKP